MRNRVEVAPQIGIHHKGVALSKQPVHFAKRVFAAKTRAKAITHLQELPLKDGLQHKLKRRLYDAVFNYRYSQRTHLSFLLLQSPPAAPPSACRFPAPTLCSAPSDTSPPVPQTA